MFGARTRHKEGRDVARPGHAPACCLYIGAGCDRLEKTAEWIANVRATLAARELANLQVEFRVYPSSFKGYRDHSYPYATSCHACI